MKELLPELGFGGTLLVVVVYLYFDYKKSKNVRSEVAELKQGSQTPSSGITKDDLLEAKKDMDNIVIRELAVHNEDKEAHSKLRDVYARIGHIEKLYEKIDEMTKSMSGVQTQMASLTEQVKFLVDDRKSDKKKDRDHARD